MVLSFSLQKKYRDITMNIYVQESSVQTDMRVSLVKEVMVEFMYKG